LHHPEVLLLPKGLWVVSYGCMLDTVPIDFGKLHEKKGFENSWFTERKTINWSHLYIRKEKLLSNCISTECWQSATRSINLWSRVSSSIFIRIFTNNSYQQLALYNCRLIFNSIQWSPFFFRVCPHLTSQCQSLLVYMFSSPEIPHHQMIVIDWCWVLCLHQCNLPVYLQLYHLI